MDKPIVDDLLIERVVHTFYSEVRTDPLIGPIFNHAIQDWDEHLDRLVAFWSSIMNTSGRYKGNPMMKHLAIPDMLGRDRFTRWLEIWRETTDRLCPPEIASAFQDRAARISESLQLGIRFAKARQNDRKEIPRVL
ncbi:group III truncated hemoglobin [Qipengyuania sp. GH25]|uniref:Group III truncated hemoglobin n=1 Tax=Qipengyuania pacifica TaxID=2860199 RepID=A0ABS7JK79_9SPHN|nr:group III truncated hemoglobin [Qipengyuania aerophila]MBX7489792.1 group III truncated hemoglobin [Qipengyuania aerophila]